MQALVFQKKKDRDDFPKIKNGPLTSFFYAYFMKG